MGFKSIDSGEVGDTNPSWPLGLSSTPTLRSVSKSFKSFWPVFKRFACLLGPKFTLRKLTGAFRKLGEIMYYFMYFNSILIYMIPLRHMGFRPLDLNLLFQGQVLPLPLKVIN